MCIRTWSGNGSTASPPGADFLISGCTTFATAALGSVVPLKIVSTRLGHASPEFTARVYQHVLPAMDQDAAAAIAALIVDPDDGSDVAEDGSRVGPR
jgi:hypothetical protein